MVLFSGWLLGPIVFGSVIDGVCDVWESTCDGRGFCLLYDNDMFRLLLHAYVTGARALGCLFTAFAYLSSRLNMRMDGLAAD